MLNTSEQVTISNLNDKLEDLKKIMKQYSKYTLDSQTEFEAHFKKYGSFNKQYSQQIMLSANDPISLGQNLIEFIQLFDLISKAQLSSFSEFQQFLSQNMEQYNEKMKIFTKTITDGNFQQSQQLAQHRQNYKKTKDKYEKLCKDIELTLNQSKKNSVDALTGYDLNLSHKNDQKLKELIKQVEPAEQQYKDTSDNLIMKTKEFNQAVYDSRQKLIQAHQLTYSRFVEIFLKLAYYKLSTNTHIKGYIDQKYEKVIEQTQYDSEIEDRIITSRYEQDNSFRYINIMNKIVEKKPITDQEYLIFPDVLHKHIDALLSIINDRFKNQKTLPAYLTEMSNQMDTISKNLQKSIKTTLQFIQDKSDKDKSNFIKPILNVQEILVKQNDLYSKKYNQYSQFMLLKAQGLDGLIKENKNQEKSFFVIYQKMIKDFQTIKQQILENEQKPTVKENLLQQLKKSIQENCLSFKNSVESLRSNEQQRQNQIIQLLSQIITHHNLLIEETTSCVQQQVQTLDQTQNQIEQFEYEKILKTQLDQQDFKFQKIFEMTDEIKSKIEATLLQQQEESDSDDINLEEGSVKVSQKLIEKFRILDGDKCIASYACAFDNKILLQGRMYIFSSKICFHSYFNGKTLFGTTALGIPSCEIQSIKRIKAYMVDAAIEFKTTKGNLVFASLANRERTLGSLKQVKGLEEGIIEDKISNESAEFQQLAKPLEKQSGVKTPSPKYQTISNENTNLKNLELQNDKSPKILNKQQQQQQMAQISNFEQIQHIIDQQQSIQLNSQLEQNQEIYKQTKNDRNEQQVQNMKKDIQQQSNPALPQISLFEVQQPSLISNELYNEIMIQAKQNRFMNSPDIVKFQTQLKVTVKEFIDFFLLDIPYENYISFPHYYQVVICQDKEINFQKYQPEPKIGHISKRPIKFIHPIKEKQMFAPDVVHCFAEDVLYYFSHDEILIEKEVKFAKIPYADSFCCRVFWHIHQIQGGCQVNYGFYIHFLKSTVFKSKIENGSKKENTEVWEKCLKQIYEEGQKKIIIKRIKQEKQKQQFDKIEIKQSLECFDENQIIQAEKEEKQFLVQQTVQENQPDIQQIQQLQIENRIKEIIVEKQQLNFNIQDFKNNIDKLTQLSYAIIILIIINIILTIGK